MRKAEVTVEGRDRAAFVERLNTVVALVGSVNALAKKAGLSQAGVRSYLHGSEPTRRVIDAIADAAGVSRSWLYNGDGQMARLGADQIAEVKEGVFSPARGLLAAVSQELRAVISKGTSNAADALGDKYDEILEFAYEELSAGVSAGRSFPSRETIRAMIKVSIWRLAADETELLVHEPEEEPAHA